MRVVCKGTYCTSECFLFSKNRVNSLSCGSSLWPKKWHHCLCSCSQNVFFERGTKCTSSCSTHSITPGSLQSAHIQLAFHAFSSKLTLSTTTARWFYMELPTVLSARRASPFFVLKYFPVLWISCQILFPTLGHFSLPAGCLL